VSITSQRVLMTRVRELTTNLGASGSVSDKLESADDKGKRADDKLGSIWECQRQARERQ